MSEQRYGLSADRDVCRSRRGHDLASLNVDLAYLNVVIGAWPLERLWKALGQALSYKGVFLGF